MSECTQQRYLPFPKTETQLVLERIIERALVAIDLQEEEMFKSIWEDSASAR